MRIVHVAPSLEDRASGMATVIPAFAAASAAGGQDVELFSLGSRAIIENYDFIQKKFEIDWSQVPIVKRLQSSARMQAALQVSSSDIIHSHGLWGMNGIYAAQAKAAKNCKLIVSPHGMLATEALRYSAWNKKFFSTLWQNKALAAADVFHATSETEFDDIRRAGWKQPVAIIAPGIETIEAPKKVDHQKMRTLLYIGRIHPIKRLGDLLDVWRDLEVKHPLWRVRIIGPDQSNEALHLKQRIASEGLRRINIEPPLFGNEKSIAFAEADLFVLPTQSENFAMVVAEALAQAVPVVCSKGAPWPGLETERCGWWSEVGPEALRTALNSAMQLPPNVLRQMGERGRLWMIRDFSWGVAAEKLKQTYQWVLQKGEHPEFIREIRL